METCLGLTYVNVDRTLMVKNGHAEGRAAESKGKGEKEMYLLIGSSEVRSRYTTSNTLQKHPWDLLFNLLQHVFKALKLFAALTLRLSFLQCHSLPLSL